jgi:hypothetical protein
VLAGGSLAHGRSSWDGGGRRWVRALWLNLSEDTAGRTRSRAREGVASERTAEAAAAVSGGDDVAAAAAAGAAGAAGAGAEDAAAAAAVAVVGSGPALEDRAPGHDGADWIPGAMGAPVRRRRESLAPTSAQQFEADRVGRLRRASGVCCEGAAAARKKEDQEDQEDQEVEADGSEGECECEDEDEGEGEGADEEADSWSEEEAVIRLEELWLTTASASGVDVLCLEVPNPWLRRYISKNQCNTRTGRRRQRVEQGPEGRGVHGLEAKRQTPGGVRLRSLERRTIIGSFSSGLVEVKGPRRQGCVYFAQYAAEHGQERLPMMTSGKTSSEVGAKREGGKKKVP